MFIETLLQYIHWINESKIIGSNYEIIILRKSRNIFTSIKI